MRSRKSLYLAGGILVFCILLFIFQILKPAPMSSSSSSDASSSTSGGDAAVSNGVSPNTSGGDAVPLNDSSQPVFHIVVPDSFSEVIERSRPEHWAVAEKTVYEAGKLIKTIDTRKMENEEDEVSFPLQIPSDNHDIVICGALIRNCRSISIYNAQNKCIDSVLHFLPGEKCRMKNIPAGDYRIVVVPFDKSAAVECLLKIYLELTAVDLSFPELQDFNSFDVENIYGQDLYIEHNENLDVVPPHSTATILLDEGYNSIKAYLKGNGLVSLPKTGYIRVDTLPPQITIEAIYEFKGKLVVLGYANESPFDLTVNGEILGIDEFGSEPNKYRFGTVVSLDTTVLHIEARDQVGNKLSIDLPCRLTSPD